MNPRATANQRFEMLAKEEDSSNTNVHPFHIQNQFQNQNLNYFKSPHHNINITSHNHNHKYSHSHPLPHPHPHPQPHRPSLPLVDQDGIGAERFGEDVILEVSGEATDMDMPIDDPVDGNGGDGSADWTWRRNVLGMDIAGVVHEAWSRGKWLLALMVLQSSSSFLLEKFEVLLREHLVVTLFLTMLVGAGGNAGNQSAIKVIEGMATKRLKNDWNTVSSLLTRQVLVGFFLGVGLAGCSFLRVFITDGDYMNSVAISLSLLSIVFFSVVLGSSLPFFIDKMGLDAGNAATCIQVIMDILGVAITCVICKLILG